MAFANSNLFSIYELLLLAVVHTDGDRQTYKMAFLLKPQANKSDPISPVDKPTYLKGPMRLILNRATVSVGWMPRLMT